jgi:hypothetical protein
MALWASRRPQGRRTLEGSEIPPRASTSSISLAYPARIQVMNIQNAVSAIFSLSLGVNEGFKYRHEFY